jgi:hypothetical protein
MSSLWVKLGICGALGAAAMLVMETLWPTPEKADA